MSVAGRLPNRPPFFHGKRVELSTQHDGWSSSVLENGDNSGAANMLGHLVAQATQTVGQLRRSLGLVARKLRIVVQVEIQRVRLGIHGLDFF